MVKIVTFRGNFIVAVNFHVRKTTVVLMSCKDHNIYLLTFERLHG